ncbi:MAG: nitroreductase family protein [Proteobacteria bacterium]|nr:nitroreductase family protein [Pseudomonadota bacterium]
MTTIRVDETLCTKCLLCVKDCVSGVFREKDGAPDPAYPELCNRCSHCLAICPAGAVIHDALDMGQATPVRPKLLDPEGFEEVIRSRRSVRRYKDRAVAEKTIQRLLDLARYSPTASNDQDVGYIVITDRAVIQKISRRIFGLGKGAYRLTQSGPVRLALWAARASGVGAGMLKYADGMEYYQEESARGRDFICHNAPALILIHGPARSSFSCDNCNIAAATITNHAHALGLGTCYLGFVTVALRFLPNLRKLVGLPRGKKVFASLTLGHPKYKWSRTTSRKPAPVAWVRG